MSLSLQYKSNKAYEFMKKYLTLPSNSSLVSWMSHIECKPGFLKEVVDFLNKLYDDDRDMVLIIDAMSIKEGLSRDKKEGKFVGFVDFGEGEETGDAKKAKEALFFMLTSLNGRWNLPFAYFLQRSTAAKMQAQLIDRALSICNQQGVRIRSIVFDGAPANFRSFKILHNKNEEDSENDDDDDDDERELIEDIENDDFENIENQPGEINPNDEEDSFTSIINMPYKFKNPHTNSNIYLIPDACHMVKLARNCLADQKIMKSTDGFIEWKFIQELHSLQEQLALQFANKLRKTHVQFLNNKMKVKYAVQTLSSSVADAIDFLRKENVLAFQGSAATTNFIRILDRIFDFLNSKNPVATNYKSPLRFNNLEFHQKEVRQWQCYLLSLKTMNDKPLYVTKRKTFVIGFVVALESVLGVAIDLKESSLFFRYLLTYNFSQDHLELFFGILRQRLGSNDNPTALQLKYIMRRILMKNSISATNSGNCLAFNENASYGNVVHITARKNKKDAYTVPVDEHVSSISGIDLKDIFGKDDNELSYLEENVDFYFSGAIQRTLTKRITCEECCAALTGNASSGASEHCYVKRPSNFLNFKNRGGLSFPSDDLYTVVRTCHGLMKSYGITGAENEATYLHNLKTLNERKMLVEARNMLLGGEWQLVFLSLRCNHSYELVTECSKYYFKAMMYHIETNFKNANSIRNKLKKIVDFKNM